MELIEYFFETICIHFLIVTIDKLKLSSVSNVFVESIKEKIFSQPTEDFIFAIIKYLWSQIVSLFQKINNFSHEMLSVKGFVKNFLS